MKADRATASASRVRYFRRAGKAAGFWPWGWLPLLGLGLTFVYGLVVTAPQIQARTIAGVTERLSTDDIAVLDVEAHGQRVLVRADVSANKQSIRESAGAATCRTWLTDAVCATGIDLEIVAASPGSPRTAGTSAVGAPVAEAKPHRFNFKVRENAVVLRGEVPTEEVRRALVLEATTMFEDVSDRLTVTGDRSDASFDWARERALRVLAELHSGQVIWQSRRMSVRGVASDRNQVIIRNSLTNGPDARPGQIILQPLMTDEDCNKQFAALLEGGELRFARGSSTLLPESAAVLERVAKLARDCKRPLLIAGHTDSRGRRQDNLDLSRARAEAVRAVLVEQGVAGSRLKTRGYGDAQPVADNATAAGRAANRRIDIRVAESVTAQDGDAAGDARAAVPAAPPQGRPATTAASCSAQFEALLDGNALRFARGSSTLLPESAPLLERVAQLARECTQPLLIAGHTDSRGRAQDNRDLSRARAESVKAELMARGVAGSRLTTRGYGDGRPVADNATAAGRAANRRIEILTMEGN